MNVYGSTLASGGKVEYSTSEHVVGTYNGSTLYERTYTGTLSSGDATDTVASFSYYSGVVSFEGAAYKSDKTSIPICFYLPGVGNYVIPYVANGSLLLAHNSVAGGYNYRLTVRYTK